MNTLDKTESFIKLIINEENIFSVRTSDEYFENESRSFNIKKAFRYSFFDKYELVRMDKNNFYFLNNQSSKVFTLPLCDKFLLEVLELEFVESVQITKIEFPLYEINAMDTFKPTKKELMVT